MTSDDTATPSTSSTVHASVLERLSDSVTREWLADRKIVAYSVTDVRRESVDTWIAACKEDFLNWPADRPLLVLHDFSGKGSALTPYARQRAVELVRLRQELKGRAAVVLPDTFAASIIELFMYAQHGSPRIERGFSSREKALNWLLSR